MGVGKIFSRGASRGFSQIFFQGGKSGEICFLPLKIEKTTISANNFKIQGGLPPSPPSDAHGLFSYIQVENPNMLKHIINNSIDQIKFYCVIIITKMQS